MPLPPVVEVVMLGGVYETTPWPATHVAVAVGLDRALVQTIGVVVVVTVVQLAPVVALLAPAVVWFNHHSAYSRADWADSKALAFSF